MNTQGMKLKNTSIECTICCSGFLVEPDDKYCGFCGKAVQSCDLKIVEITNPPLYVDQDVPIEIQLRINNTGMIPLELSKLSIQL